MNIKRMMAGFTAAALMLGMLSTTCFAASAENDDSKTNPAAVTECAATDTGNTEEEQLPYEVDVDEDGNWYQFVIPERTGYVYKDYVDMLKKEEESGTIDEEFLSMLLFLMMNSMEQAANTTPLTPDGNLTLVDDIGPSSGAGQQFITLVTKSGNYFYLIIDRNDKGEENVHFLNMVDEADLFALMDEEQVKAFQTAQDAANSGKEEPASAPQAPSETEEPEQQEPPKAEKKSVPVLPIIGVFIILIACGGGYFMMQAKKKKAAEQRPNPDVDYTDDVEEEYEIPEEDEDESYPEDDAEYMPEPEDTEE